MEVSMTVLYLTAGFFIKTGIECIEVLGIQPFLRQSERFTETGRLK